MDCDYCDISINCSYFDYCERCNSKLCPRCDNHEYNVKKLRKYNAFLSICGECHANHCVSDNDIDNDTMNECDYCLEMYCDEKQCKYQHETIVCQVCQKKICRSKSYDCEYCDKVFCKIERGTHIVKCNDCSGSTCVDKKCNDCNHYFCDECNEDHMLKCLYCGSKYCEKNTNDKVCCNEGICGKCIYKLDAYANLMTEIQALKEEILHLKYQPGGSGYQETKEHFESLAIED
jgi:hypothetical protein